MGTCTRVRALACAAFACGAFATAAAHAQPPRGTPPSAAGSSDGSDQLSPAEKIANEANDLYQQGKYREAIAKYEEALQLDPNAAILVRNIAVLHEKLGEIDQALEYFKRYGGMDIPQDARTRNEVDIRRLEGAKAEIAEKQRLAEQRAQEQQPPPSGAAPPPTTEPPQRGRVDALTLGAAGLAVVGLGFGAVMAFKATADKPQSGFVTGKDGTYADLSDKASHAHREAVMADIGFGVGVAAGATAVLLYVLRTKDPAAPVTEPATEPAVSAVPLRDGGALVWHGVF